MCLKPINTVTDVYQILGGDCRALSLRLPTYKEAHCVYKLDYRRVTQSISPKHEVVKCQAW